METCYKLFRRDCLMKILPQLQQDRFGFEPEVTALIAQKGFRVYEMGISYSGRTYKEGKKINYCSSVLCFAPPHLPTALHYCPSTHLDTIRRYFCYHSGFVMEELTQQWFEGL